jgi:hypothetical protein
MTEDEGFLQRWSRRKQSALRDEEQDSGGETPESAEVADESGAVAQNPPVDAPSDDGDGQPAAEAEPPGDEDMPPLESIDQGGSVQPFFSPRVSEGLRRAALRRLFRQPKYNVVDMLDDYAEDYSKPAALGSIVTADMRYRAEQAAKRAERKLKDALATKVEETDSLAATEVSPDVDSGVDRPTEVSAHEAPEADDETLADAGDSPEAPDEGDSDPDRRPG